MTHIVIYIVMRRFCPYPGPRISSPCRRVRTTGRSERRINGASTSGSEKYHLFWRRLSEPLFESPYES